MQTGWGSQIGENPTGRGWFRGKLAGLTGCNLQSPRIFCGQGIIYFPYICAILGTGSGPQIIERRGPKPVPNTYVDRMSGWGTGENCIRVWATRPQTLGRFGKSIGLDIALWTLSFVPNSRLNLICFCPGMQNGRSKLVQ